MTNKATKVLRNSQLGEYVLSRRKKVGSIAAVLIATVSLVTGCSSKAGEVSKAEELTIYSGRSEEFIAPFFAQWEKNSGIKLNIRYGDSAELAAQILEEGKNSPADLFLSQDAGSLGAVSEAGLFIQLKDGIGSKIASKYIAADRNWIGVTGRARVFAYDPKKVTSLPSSVDDLTKPLFKSQVGIAPTNSSFQAFVTAFIASQGEAKTRAWLEALMANDVKIYPKNGAIVEAIDKGEISIGLVNHYYIYEISAELGREINVKNGFFAAGDIGNLINVSGAGILASSKKHAAAEELINFLTSEESQKKFVSDTKEYSLIDNFAGPEGLPLLNEIAAPAVDLASLKDVSKAQDLLLSVGLL